jgi:hypothetical protein
MATLWIVILGVVIAHFVIKGIESLVASESKYKADKRRYAEQKNMLHVHAALAAQRAAKEKRDRDYPTWPEGAHSPWSPLISENEVKKSQAPAGLGDLLVKEKVITPEQLEQATKLQKDSHTRLASALVKLGFLSDEDVTNFLSRQYGVPAINNLSYLEIDPAVVKLIPYETAKRHQILPLSRVGPSLTIAMVNPTNVFTTDEIKFMTGFNIEPVVASESSIIEGIDKAYGTKGEQL